MNHAELYIAALNYWRDRQEVHPINAALFWWENGRDAIDLIAMCGDRLKMDPKHPTITIELSCSNELLRSQIAILHRVAAQKVADTQRLNKL